MVEYFINGKEKSVLVNSNAELLILIQITEKNEFEDIGYVFIRDIKVQYLDTKISASELHELIKLNGKLFPDEAFINSDEKLFNEFF